MIVIAVKSQLPQADFGCLAQPGLAFRRGGDTSKSLDTPLGKLLETAMYRNGSTRGVPSTVAGEMGMGVITWHTEPAAKQK